MSALLSTGDVFTVPVAIVADAANLVAAKAAGTLGGAFRVRVLGGLLVAGAAGAVIKFQSQPETGDKTDLTGTMPLAANVTFPLDIDGIGHLETNEGEALTLLCTGAVNGYLRCQYIR